MSSPARCKPSTSTPIHATRATPIARRITWRGRSIAVWAAGFIEALATTGRFSHARQSQADSIGLRGKTRIVEEVRGQTNAESPETHALRGCSGVFAGDGGRRSAERSATGGSDRHVAAQRPGRRTRPAALQQPRVAPGRTRPGTGRTD